MPSTLAAQISKDVSLNAPLLSETARKKHFASSSYLFSSSTKGQIDDLDSIHALAINALSQLRQVYPSISVFNEHSHVHRTLFSQRAKEIDRTLLAKDDLAELNVAIKTCLGALGLCLLENATGRVLEWLVRRFRINEFNVPEVLALFLPYHESSHFAKMVSILTVDENSPWRFLAAYKLSGKAVQRSVLVTEMLKDRELARFVTALLPETLSVSGGSNIHRTLICFNTSVLLEFVTRADRKYLDAATLAFFLPALTDPLKVGELSISQSLRKDGILGSYVLLAALSQKCVFTTPAVKTIVSTMVHCASATSEIGAYQLITALTSFLGAQEVMSDVPSSVVEEMMAFPDILEALKACLEWAGGEKLILPILGRLVENLTSENHAAAVQLLITAKRAPKSVLKHLARKILLKNKGSELLTGFYHRYPDVLRSAVDELVAEDEGKRLELEQTFMALAMPGSSDQAPQDVILASSSADPSVRASAVRMNTVAPNLSSVLRANHALYESLGSDSLLFLSGVWIAPSLAEGIDQDTVRYIALRHASAFLRAQPAELPVDFQVILPALLAALQASDRRIRVAAMECVSNLAALSAGSKPTAVYAYDQVYGTASAGLQYLDWSDECKYINLLMRYGDHLVNDADYLVLFHHEHISRSKAENKKDSRQRHRILCFLLSHVVCCPSLTVRLSILGALRRVSDPIKLQMLLPVIEKGLDSLSSVGDDREQEIYALKAFDSSAAKELNSEDSGAWPILLRALQHFHGGLTEHWTHLCTTLRESLFAALSAKRQLEISLKLIELGSATEDEVGIKRLLAQCVKQPSLMIALLQSLQPNIRGTSERAPKRAKTNDPSSNSESSSLSRLSFLAEVLSSQKLPGSLELVSGLLDTLGRAVASSTPAQTDLIYVEQLLMSCLESAASEIQELPNLAPSAVRLDVLVELMRISENPQTFHQALLLMASLARLSPTSVLHNVMPIFTFMGSNVFHRDDSYSFKVIQKTIESIVPVATASLKQKNNNTLDLFVDSRDFLRTFTDAFTHIPRHRRTSFFTHLIDVLNPVDYLAPVLILLADKSANRVSRQDRKEAQTSLVLPLSIMEHYAPNIELSAMKEIIKEVQRLSRTIKEPASFENVFLEVNASEEQAVPPSTLRKRQCQTLLIFVGLGMKQMSVSRLATSSDDMQFIITSLMELAVLDQNEQGSSDLREIGSSAEWSLHQSMAVISATYFSSITLSMLSSQNRKIYRGAFDLLASRVPEMKIETREEISPVMAQIVYRLKEIIPSLQDQAAMTESMKAILSIASSSCSKEEPALTSIVPVVIDVIRKYPGASQAVAVIPMLTTRLGPRIIPHLRALIDTCVSLVKSTDKALGHDSLADGLRALFSLLKTIPSFWGAQEIKLVVDLYLDEELAAAKGLSSQLEKLLKLLAKQLPSKILISSLLQCWPPTEELKRPNGPGRYRRFFELLKRCLHFAARSDVLENLRGLFNHFLQAFDIRSEVPSNDVSSLEDNIIVAYLELVVKLNETAFQPLFRKSCDWAFGDNSSSDRQITFCRHYSALLDLFKELMTPYMALLVSHFVELLTSFQKEENTSKELWLAAIETLSKSFAADDGVHWRDKKLRLVSGPLIQQIPVCVDLKIRSGKALLSNCLSALLDCLEDDSSVKAANLAILMHTRSEDARVRIFALQCAVATWQTHGPKLRGFASETATFIIECAEDGNDDVVRACRQLKDAVEAEAGKIEGL